MSKKIISMVIIVVVLFSLATSSITVEAGGSVPTIKCQVHVQNKGWMSAVYNDTIAGTTGKALRMEAIKIWLKKNGKSMIRYRTHVSKIGWQNWMESGQTAGTTGRSLAIEALQIKLKNEYSKKYDIYYRVHVKNIGWTSWVKNGATAGTTGRGLRAEAVQIRIVIKSGSSISPVKPPLTYRSHVQDIGWMANMNENSISGTTGKSKRLEAIVINMKSPKGANGIQYNAHVAQIGWQGWKNSGQIAGTEGRSLAIEALQIRLTGGNENNFDIYYRLHVANKGWLGWAKNGEMAGTTGGGLRAEAVQIKLVNKGTPVNTGGQAYYKIVVQQMPNLESRIKMGSYSRNQNSYPAFNTGRAGKNEGCACVSYAIARSIITGKPQNPTDFDIDGTSLLKTSEYCDGNYQNLNSSGYRYIDVYQKLKQGLPVLMNFQYGAHYVVVIGVRQGANVNSLTSSDFIIVDPWGGRTIPLNQAQMFSDNSIRIRYTKASPK